MSMKNFLALAAAMFAVTFSSCSDDLIEKTPVTTNIETKSGIEGAYNSTFMDDGIPDYIADPLVDIGPFHRAEIRFKNYETLAGIEPDVFGYYKWNEDLRIPNDIDQELGITCSVNYINETRLGLEIKNKPENGGTLIVHTVAFNKQDGHAYDRYIKVEF